LRLQITVDGKNYEVEVEVPHGYSGSFPVPGAASHVPWTAAPVPQPPAVKQNGNGDTADENVCRSPIAGVVMRVNVQPGQQLQTDDLLLVLEAMKMETNVTAPFSGKVKAVNAEPGDAVQVNQVLVEFE
jgi:methylmalonyl-CoA carboxyltransferase small subunit